jgi:hypothetical protein
MARIDVRNRKAPKRMSLTVDFESWIGSTLTDIDGHKLGTIEDVYADEPSGQPLWMLLRCGRFGRRHSFVPLTDAMPDGDVVVTGYDRGQVEHAPAVDPTDALPDVRVRELYAYYGLRYDAPVAAPDAWMRTAVARILLYVS